ncbi:hypothetical protein H6762_00945 [Candidatus Nomurabacteria bacterium]|uniref:Uncharacterized protein n=1 Tax=Candidatus Dojkabacteria bacterium TaxID=2099670 RepID=A0A955I228_9BACT|nr:hypothetical protein [Candidatus Dojkabacteria bacterium]MCB9789544.1 hypothetical protein [Candidatus Nomurabacteria bacterium]
MKLQTTDELPIKPQGIETQTELILREPVVLSEILEGDQFEREAQVDENTKIRRLIRYNPNGEAMYRTVSDYRSVRVEMAGNRVVEFYTMYVTHPDGEAMDMHGMVVIEPNGGKFAFGYDKSTGVLTPCDKDYDLSPFPDVASLWESFGPQMIGEKLLGNRDEVLDQTILFAVMISQIIPLGQEKSTQDQRPGTELFLVYTDHARQDFAPYTIEVTHYLPTCFTRARVILRGLRNGATLELEIDGAGNLLTDGLTTSRLKAYEPLLEVYKKRGVVIVGGNGCFHLSPSGFRA